MDSTIPIFASGVHNMLPNEDIPTDSSQDSLGFITQDGRMKLIPGRVALGAEGAVGSIRGLCYGYKADGTQVLFRKIETKIQYLNGSVWTDIITGLTSGSEYTFSPYVSLAGTFIIATGIDGIFKIHTANPGSYLSLYSATRNDKGKSFINKGRMIMWDLSNASKTTLKLSWIDAQDATVYTTVAGEVLGAAPGPTFTGTLAAKTGTRNVFGLVITGTTGGTTETFTDNKLGVLTSDKGGTGTINYTTGVYSITFSAVLSAGNAVASYQWEDSNQKGVTDFTFSATRVPSEGNRITQDKGGDPIMAVLVGQDGGYYSIKQQSTYRLLISTDDKTFDNNIFYENMGLPFFRAAVSTQNGIMFINTSNPDKPEMTILKKNNIGDTIIPDVLFPHFKFSNFDFSDCAFDTYERYIIVFCKQLGSTQNDRILLCNVALKTVDVSPYEGRVAAKDLTGNLYIGSGISQTVYQIFNGFDDLGNAITNYWISKSDKYAGIVSGRGRGLIKLRALVERLKRARRVRFKGKIDPNQVVEVYIAYDDGGFSLLGTIRGSGSYVDYSSPQAIGSNFIGSSQIGGDDISNAYPYFMEIKLSGAPKYRKRTLKLTATGIGYFDFDFISDWDLLFFEDRLPSRFRQKQEVSLDGSQTNQ